MGRTHCLLPTPRQRCRTQYQHRLGVLFTPVDPVALQPQVDHPTHRALDGPAAQRVSTILEPVITQVRLVLPEELDLDPDLGVLRLLLRQLLECGHHLATATGTQLLT